MEGYYPVLKGGIVHHTNKVESWIILTPGRCSVFYIFLAYRLRSRAFITLSTCGPASLFILLPLLPFSTPALFPFSPTL